MSDIAFYHLTKLPLEQAIPKLLEKTLDVGKRAVIRVSSPERAEELAEQLWIYRAESWLPHGTVKDGNPDLQPIWITPEDENLNEASFLFLTDAQDSAQIGAFERVFILFDGLNEEAVKFARIQWKTYKDAGHNLAYWQQTDAGGWTKKASS